MYPIEENVREVYASGQPMHVVTYSREIIDCNLLYVEAGTNGYRGGDTGSNGRTYIRVKDLCSTDVHGKFKNGDLEIELGGDSELRTTLEALKFIVKVLEDEITECHETPYKYKGKGGDIEEII